MHVHGRHLQECAISSGDKRLTSFEDDKIKAVVLHQCNNDGNLQECAMSSGDKRPTSFGDDEIKAVVLL